MSTKKSQQIKSTFDTTAPSAWTALKRERTGDTMLHMIKDSWELGPNSHSSHILLLSVWLSLMSTAFQDRVQGRAIKPVSSQQ